MSSVQASQKLLLQRAAELEVGEASFGHCRLKLELFPFLDNDRGCATYLAATGKLRACNKAESWLSLNLCLPACAGSCALFGDLRAVRLVGRLNLEALHYVELLHLSAFVSFSGYHALAIR